MISVMDFMLQQSAWIQIPNNKSGFMRNPVPLFLWSQQTACCSLTKLPSVSVCERLLPVWSPTSISCLDMTCIDRITEMRTLNWRPWRLIAEAIKIRMLYSKDLSPFSISWKEICTKMSFLSCFLEMIVWFKTNYRTYSNSISNFIYFSFPTDDKTAF